MRIAVLAWGSLVWQPSNDHGDLCVDPGHGWQPDGPELPIEFGRISADGRLTLIALPGYVATSPVLWRRSCHDRLDDAIDNLARRETNAPRRHIHSAGHSGVLNGSPDPSIGDAVTRWLTSRTDVDAAIWTGLPPGPRWSANGHDGFSTDAALAYASSLAGEVRARAAEYVARAPHQIATPLRPRLAEILGR
ncbi:MAG TPA: hypothetical protein VLD62_01810 [Acidimicrobiia bacterium]|nr:hypothetical protein [Acidimicrobiia bacterium]